MTTPSEILKALQTLIETKERELGDLRAVRTTLARVVHGRNKRTLHAVTTKKWSARQRAKFHATMTRKRAQE